MFTDDFSFPTVVNPHTHFTISPPLWHVSSQALSSDYNEEDNNWRGGDSSRKSFSTVESEILKREMNDTSEEEEEEEEEEAEEKMDVLWEEYFNEELQRNVVCSPGKRKEVGRSLRSGASRSESWDEAAGKMGELCCVQALKMTKPSSSVISPNKRPAIVVVLKVLRRLLLLHNTARRPKKKVAFGAPLKEAFRNY